jgi:iron complex transport system ATP-binding protein
MKAPLLQCAEVKFSYGDLRVLDGINLTVHEGDFVGVIGPNGSGKSTLIKILSAVCRPTRGTVRLDGKDMGSYSRRKVAGHLAVVAQEESPDFGFSVREEVMLGRFPHHGGLHFDNESDRIIVEKCMNKTGVANLQDRRISELSGGERQRVRIARALAQEPRVLLLDEPTNHLDLYSQMAVMELMQEINRDGLAILLVSHDINFVSRTCGHVKILHEMQFRYSGPPKEVITQETISEAFGIKALVDSHPADGSPRMTPVERLSLERH